MKPSSLTLLALAAALPMAACTDEAGSAPAAPATPSVPGTAAAVDLVLDEVP